MNAKSVPSLQPKNIDTRQDQLLLTAVLRRAQQILAISQIKRQKRPVSIGVENSQGRIQAAVGFLVECLKVSGYIARGMVIAEVMFAGV